MSLVPGVEGLSGLGFRLEISRALRDMISSDGEWNQIISDIENGGLSRVDRNCVK